MRDLKNYLLYVILGRANNISVLLSLLCIAVLVFSFPAGYILAQPDTSGNADASLYIQPASGTVTLGSTFTVSVYVNTGGREVNAIDVRLEFPPDKLQVVSPTAGQSVISVWVAQPAFSNSQGTIRFQGGAPNPGIRTSAGLVSSIVFRARQVGPATITIRDDSRVLLNDGLGTNILSRASGAQFGIVLPPPAGPTVVSSTHPDQTVWYKNRNPLFSWDAPAGIQGYSYSITQDPLDEPDAISEGVTTQTRYQNLPDGIWYFHIRALGPDGAGPTTHFVVLIDGTPPASFAPEITPSKQTTDKTPIIKFVTTDASSGISHYEVKFIEVENQKNPELTPFFIEARSPFQAPELLAGIYDVVVRAHDRAGNITDEVARVEIVDPFLKPISERGIAVGTLTMPWWLFYFLVDILIILCVVVVWKLMHRHGEADNALSRGLHWVTHEMKHDIGWLKDKIKGRKHLHYDIPHEPKV